MWVSNNILTTISSWARSCRGKKSTNTANPLPPPVGLKLRKTIMHRFAVRATRSRMDRVARFYTGSFTEHIQRSLFPPQLKKKKDILLRLWLTQAITYIFSAVEEVTRHIFWKKNSWLIEIDQKGGNHVLFFQSNACYCAPEALRDAKNSKQPWTKTSLVTIIRMHPEATLPHTSYLVTENNIWADHNESCFKWPEDDVTLSRHFDKTQNTVWSLSTM